MKAADLVGAWREIGRESVGADGRVTAHAPRRSQIVYTADGYMAVVNTPADRRRMPKTDNPVNLDSLSEAERAEAALGVVAYAGRYEVDGDIVKHIVYSSLNPNVEDDTQLRRATLTGDDLTLATLPDPRGASFRIRWRRAGRM
jgi:hypothetical protein